MKTLTHSQHVPTVSITVNIHCDKTLLFMLYVVWLSWRWLARAYEVGRAVVVVAWRRIKRAMRATEKRFVFQFSLLAYGPVLGVG